MAFIHLQSVCIDFPIYNVSARSLKKQIFNLTTGGMIKDSDRKCIVVRALDKLNFRLNDGDRLALLGHNGAGKSTLLRVLAKIYEPSSGIIQTSGNIFPLFDQKLGFNQESTGFENIIIRGLLLGFSRQQILKKIDEIIEFSELGNYIHMPIRTYSQGMQMRLAFSITVSINPDILLFDEMIGTGDARFMEKAKQKLDELLKKANIIVVASHSDTLIKNLCNKALLLEKGKVKYLGDVQNALNIYYNKTELDYVPKMIDTLDPAATLNDIALS